MKRRLRLPPRLVAIASGCAFAGLLVLLVVPQITSRLFTTVCYKVPMDLAALARAVKWFSEEHGGTYPRTLDELGEAYPGGPSPLLDPWDRPYRYEVVDGVPRVFTWGRDGRPGGSGKDADTSRNVE